MVNIRLLKELRQTICSVRITVSQHIHFIGICGTGMAALAGMLKQRGHRITGSDLNVYPPMSTFLEQQQIPVYQGQMVLKYENGKMYFKKEIIYIDAGTNERGSTVYKKAKRELPEKQ